jgi:hypothetical protein
MNSKTMGFASAQPILRAPPDTRAARWIPGLRQPAASRDDEEWIASSLAPRDDRGSVE